MTELFSSVKLCPVCRTPIQSATPAPQAIAPSAGSGYLAPLFETENELETKIALIKSFRCETCKAIFLNPWFSENSRNKIFLTGHPIHKMGWSNLFDAVSSDKRPSLPLDAQLLLQEIETRIGPINTYLEVGCPLMGLLLHNTSNRQVKDWLSPTNEFGSMSMPDIKRLPQFLIDYMTFARWSTYLARLITKLRVRRRGLKHTHKTPSNKSRRIISPSFLPTASSSSWGMNCAGYGQNCSSVASSLLGATVISPTELIYNENRRFDLIGLFQTLDHQDAPLELLKLFLERSKCIVVLSHNGPFSLQHRIGLETSFFDNLPRLIPGIRVERLATKSTDSLYLLTNIEY